MTSCLLTRFCSSVVWRSVCLSEEEITILLRPDGRVPACIATCAPLGYLGDMGGLGNGSLGVVLMYVRVIDTGRLFYK